MSLLDKIENSRVDVRSAFEKGKFYEIDCDKDICGVVRVSPYKMHLVFCNCENKDDLIEICDYCAEGILEDLRGVSGIREFSNIHIVHKKFKKVYALMIGFNPDVKSAFRGIWTYYCLMGIIGRNVYIFNKKYIEMMWFDKINNFARSYLDKTYSLDNYLSNISENREMITLKLYELWNFMGTFCGRVIKETEWNEAVRKSEERHLRIRLSAIAKFS